MEVEKKIQREYNPAHPNYERWKKARDLSGERAEFLGKLLSSEVKTEGLRILDIGAGEGSTSKLFSEKNFVVSLEPKPERIKKIFSTDSLHPVLADTLNLPFKSSSFNLIILQDVIEHLNISKKLIDDLTLLLKDDGMIYLSTPNKLSILNFISDPHWGMPFVSLLKRGQVRKYFLKHFRKSDYHREDVAELLSLKDVFNLFKKNFSIKIHTEYAVDYLFSGGKGLVWSSFHLRLIKAVSSLRLNKILNGIANNRPGILNRFVTPTFYILLRRK
jgi:SAM-dependent methyltransferase